MPIGSNALHFITCNHQTVEHISMKGFIWLLLSSLVVWAAILAFDTGMKQWLCHGTSVWGAKDPRFRPFNLQEKDLSYQKAGMIFPLLSSWEITTTGDTSGIDMVWLSISQASMERILGTSRNWVIPKHIAVDSSGIQTSINIWLDCVWTGRLPSCDDDSSRGFRNPPPFAAAFKQQLNWQTSLVKLFILIPWEIPVPCFCQSSSCPGPDRDVQRPKAGSSLRGPVAKRKTY